MRPLPAILRFTLLLVGVGSAGAQTFSYLFSSCASGVSMQVTFPVKPPVITVPPPAYAFGYTSLSATFTLTVNGGSQTFTGLAGANVQYTPAITADSFALTDVLFDPSAGQGGADWAVNLQGVGSLLPNGLPPALPPISVWVVGTAGMHYDYIRVGSQFYYLDTFGPCGGSSGSSNSINSDKTLGLACDFPGCVACGEPINLGTGNVFDSLADYRTAGPNPLGFTRYYNSMASAMTFASTLGMNWRSNFDRYLRLSASSVIAERADGQQVTFKMVSGAWTADSDVDMKLTNAGATWTLTDSNDTVETYAASGASEAVLQSTRARNGYAQTLQYGASGQLSTVTDSYNRRLSFTYSGGKLQTVATPDSLVLTYGFTGTMLTSVGYSTSPPTNQTYVYENSALPTALTGVIDENGNRYITWTYDSKGRGLSSQFAGGANLMKVAYNDTDGSRTVTGALGEQTVYKFTTLQNSPKITEIDRVAVAGLAAATEKFTYDSNGFSASKTDWNGNLTTFVNDVHGQPTTVVQASGRPQARTITTTYHPTFHLPVRIVEQGLTTSFTYDTSGELLTKTQTDTTATSAPYSTAGQTRTSTFTWSNFLPVSSQTPRGAVTTFAYDSSGGLTGITNAVGQTYQVTHLPGGLPQTVVDRNGVTTNLTYDARLRLLLTTVSTAAGPLTTAFAYDAAGNLIGATLPDGSSITNTYDAAHRLTGMTDLFNQSTAITLDTLGDRTNTSLLDSSSVPQRARSGTFDALGRMLKDVRGAGQTTAYTYDANGNLLSITDPLSHATHRAFDALNRLIAVTDAAGNVISTAFDAHDRPTTITDPNGGVTTYVYDGFGDVIQRVSADSGTTVYRYDADGNLTQSVDATGAVTNHTYDTLDRVLTATYPADAAENVAYTYDQTAAGFGVGRLTSVTDAAGSLSRSYDERGNVLSETRVIGSVTLTTAYTYDAARRLSSIAYPSGWTVAYTRDVMGRITAVNAQPPGAAAAPVVANAGYQPFGPVKSLTFGNGVAETRAFDLDYRMISLADTGSGPLQSLAYSYDGDDQVTALADGVTPANSQSFSYDVLNRLTAATGTYGAFAYTYDKVGNRLTQSLGTSSSNYSYAARSSQLASVSAGGASQTIGYTKNGAIGSFTPAAGAITNLTYNQAGRLAAAMAGSIPVAQYTYDAFGHRLVKAGASTTLYQYDQRGHLLEEADNQGNPLVDYIYLDSLPVATISPADGQVYFLHNDRLGTPQAATDSSQNIVWTAGYGPFGEMSSTPSLIVQNLRLPGQEYDSDTGLYHNGFRDYAPGWGRYLQSDPIGLAGGVNTYAYAAANPVNLTDPLGLQTLADLENTVSDDWDIFTAQVQTLSVLGPSKYIQDEFPQVQQCINTVKTDYSELKSEAEQLFEKYGWIKTVADWVDAAGKFAEDEGNAFLLLIPDLYKWGAEHSQYWGNERIPPPPQANPAIENGTWGMPNPHAPK